MKNTICGIEITQEQANKIREISRKICDPRHPDNAKWEAERFKSDFYYIRATNPHRQFFGDAVEYIKKYLPEKSYLIEYM